MYIFSAFHEGRSRYEYISIEFLKYLGISMHFLTEIILST